MKRRQNHLDFGEALREMEAAGFRFDRYRLDDEGRSVSDFHSDGVTDWLVDHGIDPKAWRTWRAARLFT